MALVANRTKIKESAKLRSVRRSEESSNKGSKGVKVATESLFWSFAVKGEQLFKLFKPSRLLMVIATATLILGTATPIALASASVSQGCSKIGQQSLQKKQTLVCVGSATDLHWVQLMVAPKTKSALIHVLAGWLQSLSNFNFTPIDAKISQSVSTDSIQSLGDPTALQNNINNLQNQSQAMHQQSEALALQVSADNDAANNAKQAVTTPLANYESLSSQLNSISVSYNAAISDRTQNAACSIIVLFGFSSGPCPVDNPLDTYVIAQYNSLKTQVDTAWATYQSLQAQATSSTQTYYTDGTKKETLDAELDIVNQEIAGLQQEISTLNFYAASVSDYSKQITAIGSLNALAKSVSSDAQNRIKVLLNGNTGTISFSSAFVTYSSAKQIMDELSAAVATDNGPPNVPNFSANFFWLPTGFYKGSNYPSLTTGGSDFGWAWSNYYQCSGTCNVALMVAKTNCAGATITLDWKDSTGTKVGSTTSTLPEMTVGTVYPVGFTLPATVDSTKSYSSYLSGFQCTATQA